MRLISEISPRAGSVMERFGWLWTLKQLLPRLFNLMPFMCPWIEVRSLTDIDAKFLTSRGIQAVLWDADGTLTDFAGDSVRPEVQPTLSGLITAPGIRHAILSNSGEQRYRQLGRIFPEVPILRAYRSPRGILYRRLTGQVDSWVYEKDAMEQRGDIQPIRKPSSLLIDYALEETQCGTRGAAVMIGDQYLTDVVGANLAGIKSIKVPTLGRETFPFSVRLLQRMEEMLYRVVARTTRLASPRT